MKINNRFKMTFMLTLLILFVIVTSLALVYLTIIISNHIGLVAYSSLGIWFMLALVFLLALCFAILISKLTVGRVVKPLSEMIEITDQIAKGNFNVSISPFDSKVINASEVEQLRQSINMMANELKNNEIFRLDFINNFSHEFKTPINCILGFAKQLQYDDLTKQQVLDYSDIIVKESQRLVNLSNNVLMITKLENNKVDRAISKYNLDEQLRDAILLLQHEWENKNIQLDLNLQPIIINNDKDLLAQVWTNLISNAIKFSNNDSSITINCYKYNNKNKVEIIDNGIGMSDYDIKHIYDKFYQADRSHSTSGNGLGMALVKNILKICHGQIEIESKLNQGCKVSVWL